MRSKQCAKSCASVGIVSHGYRADDPAGLELTCTSCKFEVLALSLEDFPSVHADRDFGHFQRRKSDDSTAEAMNSDYFRILGIDE